MGYVEFWCKNICLQLRNCGIAELLKCWSVQEICLYCHYLMKITKQNMPETMYRASRCCRTLGNPTAYLILKCLGPKRKTPSRISQELEISRQAVSRTLRHLRDVDLVRYETKGQNKEYRIKDRLALDILGTLEQWVAKTRKKRIWDCCALPQLRNCGNIVSERLANRKH